MAKRTGPHKCQQCGICCQGRGDLWYDEESWPTDTEPDNCTAFDAEKCSCRVYPDRRDFCKEYPWDEWCEREQKEMGIWIEHIQINNKLALRDQKGVVTVPFYGVGPVQTLIM